MKKSKLINFVIFLKEKKMVSASREYELNLYPTRSNHDNDNDTVMVY